MVKAVWAIDSSIEGQFRHSGRACWRAVKVITRPVDPTTLLRFLKRKAANNTDYTQDQHQLISWRRTRYLVLSYDSGELDVIGPWLKSERFCVFQTHFWRIWSWQTGITFNEVEQPCLILKSDADGSDLRAPDVEECFRPVLVGRLAIETLRLTLARQQEQQHPS
ncbi:hypothetical protein BDV95DRAFT_377332 [Massariosphaeria phaeospora]|uniref:Uncharacterized protein n=1 Tax=Massariosphaeria phaeospora TaxID=100035 RepID=A0A7C8MCI4_9PLEO|nr:hypothetical protein BDV95DRAFT_377332 [Massariosphaeria phaeospora]